MISRTEAQEALARMILEKIRADRYPSYTQMAIFEEVAPRQLAGEYIQVLLSKMEDEKWPSIPMMRHIQQVTESL